MTADMTRTQVLTVSAPCTILAIGVAGGAGAQRSDSAKSNCEGV